MPDALAMVARLQNETQAGFAQIKKDMLEIAHGGAMKELMSRLSALGKALEPFAKVIKESLKPALESLGITSLTTAGAIGGLYYGMQKVAQSAIELKTLSDLTGVAAEDLKRYRYAAKIAGIEVEEWDQQLKNFGLTAAQMTAGPNKNPVGQAKALMDMLRFGDLADEHTAKLAEEMEGFARKHPGDTKGLLELLLDPVKGLFGGNIDPRIRGAILRGFGLSDKIDANFLKNAKEAPASILAAAKAAEDYAKNWQEFLDSGEDLAKVFFNMFGEPLIELLKTATDDINGVIRALHTLEKGLDAVLPKWFKEMINWKGGTVPNPPSLPDQFWSQMPALNPFIPGAIWGSPLKDSANPHGAETHSPTYPTPNQPMFGTRAGGQMPTNLFEGAKQAALLGGGGAVAEYMKEMGSGLVKQPTGKFQAWCGQFASDMVRSYGGTPPAQFQTASSWRNWGVAREGAPQPGDIAIRQTARSGGGRYIPTGETGSHVTSFDEPSSTTGKFWAFGGNQGARDRAGLPIPSRNQYSLSDYAFRYDPNVVGPSNPIKYTGGNTNPFSNPQDAPPSTEGMDSALWYRSGSSKIKGSGSVIVDVTAPPGTKVDAEGDGMFDTTTINRRKGRVLEQAAED